MGDQWRNGQEFEPPPRWDEGFEFSGADDHGAEDARFSEFFEALFRGERAGSDRASTRRARHAAGAGRDNATAQEMEDAYGGVPNSAPGQDHHAKVAIDLRDTYRGAQRTISLETPVLDASGRVLLKSRTLDVSIPKGVQGGQHLRLADQGGAGFGEGRAGDLYPEIAFRPQELSRVVGRDVTIDVPIAPWEAALGARITVPTPDGTVEIAVPKGSSGGQRLRLKGKGIPASGPAGTAGDLYARLNIALPSADSEQARAAYDALRQACDFNPRAQFSGDPS
ncbi:MULTISPECIES: DnaJ C-terminal domain-containing protein [Paraburkholderia]|uniref:DnaJ C-terminal domain-containing protein n=1 Tax=Paraburkholderia TaxID=1822464 RepID=UPI0038BD34BB